MNKNPQINFVHSLTLVERHVEKTQKEFFYLGRYERDSMRRRRDRERDRKHTLELEKDGSQGGSLGRG